MRFLSRMPKWSSGIKYPVKSPGDVQVRGMVIYEIAIY